MRLNTPRIEPVDLDRLDADQAAALAPVRDGKLGALNIFRTLATPPRR